MALDNALGSGLGGVVWGLHTFVPTDESFDLAAEANTKNQNLKRRD